MGKKRIIQKGEAGEASRGEERSGSDAMSGTGFGEGKGRNARGIAHIRTTYNNTFITVTDARGNAIAWSSAGAIGFSGAKKSTPYAASRVAEAVVEKLRKSGIQEVMVEVRGVGSGRDSAIRSLGNHGLNVVSVKDKTPVPHNGPRPPKVRRV